MVFSKCNFPLLVTKIECNDLDLNILAAGLFHRQMGGKCFSNTYISKMDDYHAPRNDCTLFQKYCEKAIGKLTDDCIENFKATTDEEARIRLLYKEATQIPIIVSPNNGKDVEIAQQEKSKGNSYFAKKDYCNALKAYNNGIIKCPQDTGMCGVIKNLHIKLSYIITRLSM